MAINTAEKRFSMMGLGNVTLKLVVPSGSVDASERATFLDLYAGIPLAAAAATAFKNYMFYEKLMAGEQL